ncbi:DUF1993 domain-containing protein [Sphingomonas aliaeris]|uniref:DUF1993 domain-containing protein n=1 Tax=Sphingomonas aliaeris TaxID=2759526 RepID=A0A974S4V3_9SPHN|nr:DUF1993 domain-containing protein [Sphingomonas aliaeris]QQV77997.1 DUF1993 domain-containing protein [Sphingomonas aliaeris]
MPTLYEISVPIFTRALRNLDHLLEKAAGSGIDEQSLLEARLSPDMLPLTRQVQIACDTAKLAVTRVAQTEPRPMEDTETNLTELRDRIARTLAYLNDAAPAAFDGRETAEIIMKFPNSEMKFTGQSLLTDFSLPNFFFHVTTAYGLLRMKGVPIGKMDFLAGGSGGS